MRNLEELNNVNPAKMTVRELRQFIRAETRKANKSVLEYKATGKDVGMYETNIKKLQEIAGVNKRTGAIKVGIAGKNKVELIRQARELKYFNKWDIYSEEGYKTMKDREAKAYEQFKKHYGDEWSYNEWRDLVEAFGAVGNALQEFGYGDKDRKAGASSGDALINAITEVKDKSKVNILTAMQRSLKENKGLSNRERIKDITDIMQGLK